ncbi:MAG: hypothetical protein RL514_541 [Verrucomicrobiota bacterium]|jgi:hypothetical protein
MNANTRLRLWKETRALLPMWAAVAVWIAAPFVLPVNDPLPYAFSGFLFGCAVMGPVCVGHEFTHRTMGQLLAQPVPRRQLWREKLAVTGAALLSLSLLFVALLQFMALRDFSKGWEKIIPRVAESDPLQAALFIAVPVLVPLMAFCTGPALTLVTRNALGGAAATFIYPFFLLIAGLLIVASMGDLPMRVEEQFLLSYVLLVGGIYSGGVFLHGCRRFERLEDANLLAQELAPPRQLSALFSCLTRHTTPGSHGATANLLRKELRLQHPAFLVAAFLVVLWLTFIVVWKVHPPVGAEMLIVPSILLVLGIPVTVGIVSTAEERNLGVHEWHLTLPVSARRQWCVKVIVALGVNAVLGLLLPGLLAHASSWLANNPQLVAEIPGRNVSPLLVANLVIFCATLYASTGSANSMRALVGAIVLFLAGAMVLNFADYLAASYPNEHDIYKVPGAVYAPPPDYLRPIHEHRWLLGWSCLAVWLYFLGLAGFRRSLESFWLPVRRMAVFFAVVCAFVFAAIAW